MIPFTVLDLAPINQGSDAAQGFRSSLDLAQHAERWGNKRFWLAEHHNFPGIASAATAVVIDYVAGAAMTIRVGSGGVMLPNQAPLVAEQFGTLESFYRDRIDLGLGRTPSTDQRTPCALRRDLATTAGNFRHDVMKLQALLGYRSAAARRYCAGRKANSQNPEPRRAGRSFRRGRLRCRSRKN